MNARSAGAPAGATNPNLTRRQQQVLDVIRAYIGANGRSPSFREIGARCGISNETVFRALNSLRADGAIRYLDGIPRSIVLAGACPTCGHAA